MSENLYITSIEPRSGKSLVALGVMELLKRDIKTVGFFRPIINAEPQLKEMDNEIMLMSSRYNLGFEYSEMYAYTFQEARNLITQGKHEELIDGILSKYNALKAKTDFVVCLGTDFEGVTSAFEFDINAEIATNLSSPVLIVTNAKGKSKQGGIKACHYAVKSFEGRGCNVLSVIVNRCEGETQDDILKELKTALSDKVDLVYGIEDDKLLCSLTMEEVATHLNANVIYGHSQLNRHISKVLVAAMHLGDFLEYCDEGSLIIVPSDRLDIIFGTVAALKSNSMPNISGMILTGKFNPNRNFYKMIEGISDIFPILKVNNDTFSTATEVNTSHTRITPSNNRKIAVALGHFEAGVNTEELRQNITSFCSQKITPKMFEFSLVSRARKHKQHIVLPEGTEPRILQAAEILHNREVCNFTLLGKEDDIRKKISELGLNLDGVQIIEPYKSDYFDDFVSTYMELRAHKGITKDAAKDAMSSENYFGTMMIHKGLADGMVSGAVHSTRFTILPSFEIIKTKPSCSIVSSVFLMCLADKVLVYGDCAVNPNPNAEQLAEIAISSADTGKIFGIEPAVAMLSYSTGDSGVGADVEKVRNATAAARDLRPDLNIEGPIQYDAAVEPSVAITKMPDSKVAGKATVLVFPDLNTGNNTYKAVQRSANAVAIGPILQGLNKPVNDLSRGCTIPDIVNTISITAIQAQAEKGLL